MKSSTLKSQAGFSLVELMVVVAIIGVLAAMSVGQVQKQIAKARQSEAKTNLASLYTSAQAFRSEYNTFTTDFSIMKLDYAGRLRYNTGFNANDWPNASVAPFGYTGGIGASAADFNTTVCGVAGGDLLNCTENAEATQATTTAAIPVANTANQTTFQAMAQSEIFRAGLVDQWTIDQNKDLRHPTEGIP